MPRPRLNQSTVDAINMTVDEISEFEAESFDMDTKIRMIVHKYATSEVGKKHGYSLRRVKDLTEKYDLPSETTQ